MMMIIEVGGEEGWKSGRFGPLIRLQAPRLWSIRKRTGYAGYSQWKSCGV